MSQDGHSYMVTLFSFDIEYSSSFLPVESAWVAGSIITSHPSLSVLGDFSCAHWIPLSLTMFSSIVQTYTVACGMLYICTAHMWCDVLTAAARRCCCILRTPVGGSAQRASPAGLANQSAAIVWHACEDDLLLGRVWWGGGPRVSSSKVVRCRPHGVHGVWRAWRACGGGARSWRLGAAFACDAAFRC